MRMLHNHLNLEVTKGDTLSFGVKLNKINQALDAAHFTCKTNFNDIKPIFEKHIDSGITLDHVNGEDYYYKVRITPEDTEMLECGKYYYDLQIEVNMDVFTIMKGIFTLDYDVTQRRVF